MSTWRRLGFRRNKLPAIKLVFDRRNQALNVKKTTRTSPLSFGVHSIQRQYAEQIWQQLRQTFGIHSVYIQCVATTPNRNSVDQKVKTIIWITPIDLCIRKEDNILQPFSVELFSALSNSSFDLLNKRRTYVHTLKAEHCFCSDLMLYTMLEKGACAFSFVDLRENGNNWSQQIVIALITLIKYFVGKEKLKTKTRYFRLVDRKKITIECRMWTVDICDHKMYKWPQQAAQKWNAFQAW